VKLSVTTLGTLNVISPEDLMPKLEQWGYDGIELWGGDLPGGQHTKWYQDDSVRIADLYPGDRATQQELDRIMELKRLADKHNLEIPMISNYFDFIAGKQRWEESIVIASRYIEYAQAMGVRLIRTMTGGYGSGFKSGEGVAHAAGTEVPSSKMTDEQWEGVISGLKAVTSLPGADKVIFAIETHRGRPEDSIESIAKEVNDTGASNLKVLLQPNQFIPRIPGMTAQKMLDALYEHTVHIHVRTGMKDSEVGWDWLLPELMKRGYDGYVSLEGIVEPKLQSIEQEVKWFKQATAK
jgi:sugar phosphate isomerase/epimerase